MAVRSGDDHGRAPASMLGTKPNPDVMGWGEGAKERLFCRVEPRAREGLPRPPAWGLTWLVDIPIGEGLNMAQPLSHPTDRSIHESRAGVSTHQHSHTASTGVKGEVGEGAFRFKSGGRIK